MTDDEQAIRHLITTWLEASNARDTATVLGLMDDDVEFLMPGRPPMRGKSEFAAMQQALGSATVHATGEVREVRVLGDWAWCSTRLTVVITPEGSAPMRHAGCTLSVLRRKDGRWLLYRDANMVAPE